MSDMLVKLYGLGDSSALMKKLARQGIQVRRPIPPEKPLVVDWVRRTFNAAWASECEVSFSNHPVSCFIAVKNGQVLGFACYDSTCLNFFGPTGVVPAARNRGIGKALLLSCLNAMAGQGYAYAIIGGVGPAGYYAKTVGAVPIRGSKPGIYSGMLKPGQGRP